MNEVIGKGFQPGSVTLERFRGSVHSLFKRIGFYRGIRLVKSSGLSRLYRTLNSKKEKGDEHIRLIEPHKERMKEDLKKILELKEIDENSRIRIREWLSQYN